MFVLTELSVISKGWRSTLEAPDQWNTEPGLRNVPPSNGPSAPVTNGYDSVTTGFCRQADLLSVLTPPVSV